MLTLIESLKEIEKTFDQSKSFLKKEPIRGQSREDWDKGRVGRTKMDLIKEEYDMFSLKGIISLKNLEKSMDMSVALYNKFITSDKHSKVKPMSFIEFYSRLIHWEKLYGTSDSKVKELQKFYRRRNKEIKKFEIAKNMEMTQEELMEIRRELSVLQTDRRFKEKYGKNKKTKKMKNDYELFELEKTMSNHHNITISTKLSLSIKDKLEKHCSKIGKSTSTLIREMIVAYLENRDFQERVLNHITLTEIDKLQERIDVLQKSLVKKKRKYTITKPRRTPMTVAKEIRREGENWKDALKRASKILIQESQNH